MTEVTLLVLRYWIILCLVVATVAIVLFLIFYGLSKWQTSKLGRIFMLNKAAYALILFISIVFRFEQPDNPIVTQSINALRYGLIAYATLALTLYMIKLNFIKRKDDRNERSDEDSTIQ